MVGLTFAAIAAYKGITDTSVRDAMKYIIPNVFIGLYALFYIIKYKFTFKVVERIFMFVQDALIIAVLNIFIHKY